MSALEKLDHKAGDRRREDRGPGRCLSSAVNRLMAGFQASKPWRAWKRYGDARGVGAGAVLGATAMAAIGLLVRGSQSVIRLVRG